MEVYTEKGRGDDNTNNTTSLFLASLLVVLVTSAHIAGRGGVSWEMIRLILVIIVLVSLVLYTSGTFQLMGDIVKIVRNSDTSLRSAAGIGKFCRDVQALAESQMFRVLLLITVVYLFLQTLCVPGTVVLNAATGAVIGTLLGVPYCTLLGTVGASCCYLLSNYVGMRLVERVDARLMKGKGLSKIRTQVHRHRSELFVYLLFLRLTPILPNWLVNLASPVVGVPIRVFALATFVGIVPQTYLTVRFGAFARVSGTAGRTSIVSPWDTLLLAVIGAAIVAAMVLKRRFMPAGAAGLDASGRAMVFAV
ncbi:SNARE associated golgi family protein [Trypanosoma theileri]|uniref:SNARE associated golgi family protein n=1 Tax=Trypanosoma theileri TaxID=67003 RepID=A0A1X0NMH8_9TRYP|nr:SNARE associated golgi family protein [Trypanosoma theileri]ORC85887.1 SNARE associated golgi family protein [Trypanosoma theileri]